MGFGKLYAYERLEFRLYGSGAGSGTGDQQWGGAIVAAYATSPTGVANGFALTAGGVNDGSPELRYTLDIPGVWSPSDKVEAYATDFDTELHFLDFTVYSTDSYYYITWSGIEWYVDGLLYDSDGAGSISGSDPYLTPTSIPIIGSFPYLYATASYNPIPAYPPGLGSASGATASCTASGGWRFKRNGVYVVPPAVLELPSFVNACGSCAEGISPTLTVTNCYTATVSALSSYSISPTFSFTETNSSGVYLVPNWARYIKRGNSRFREMVYRGGMPYSKKIAYGICQGNLTDPDPPSTTQLTTVTPSQDEYLSIFSNSANLAEDTLGLTILCPTFKYRSRVSVSDNSGNFCDNTQTVSFGISDQSIETRTSNSAILPYLNHVSPVFRYINTICHPHWSFFDWFPPDEVGPIKSYEWTLYGDRANPTDYWLPNRQQYSYHPALPDLGNLRRRIDLISSPLTQGAYNGYVNAVFGQFTSWLGVSRFQIHSSGIYPRIVVSDNNNWSFTDCTPSFGSDIQLTSTGPTTIEATLELGDFTNKPYMTAYQASRIILNWTNTNIADVQVYLDGYEGSSVKLSDNSKGVKVWPTDGTGTKYIGSWGQFLAGLFDLLDAGTDLDAAGDSALAMSDEEQVHFFQLLQGRTAKQLRFVITLASAASPCNINFPSFSSERTTPEVFYETPFTTILLEDNAYGIRLGQWSFWNAGFSNPPIINGLGFNGTQTVLDWLCTSRLVFEGKDAEDNLDTEIASLYDSVEGNTRADLVLWTMGWICGASALGGFYSLPIALCNTFAEVPPLQYMPRAARDTDFQETGDLCLEVWSWATDDKLLISQGTQPVKFKDKDWISAHERSVNGWYIGVHRHEVDNTEGATFTVQKNGFDYATVSPWHGYFSNLDPDENSGNNPANLYTQMGETFRSYTKDDNIWIKTNINGLPFPDWQDDVQVTDTDDCDESCIAVGPNRRLYVVYNRSGTGICYKYSDDEGATWNSETVLWVDGMNPRITSNDAGDILTVRFVYDSGSSGPGTLVAKYRGSGDTSFSSEFTFQNALSADLSVTDDGHDICASRDSQGRWLLTCTLDGESAPKEFYSADINGESWTEL